MKEQENTADISQNTENQIHTKKRKHPFLVLLMIFCVISSCVAGYIIDRIVDFNWYSGQIIDTILLSPGEWPDDSSTSSDTIILQGSIIYSDGTPYRNGIVELQSEPRYTTTDDNGYFYFENVEPGTHTISVLNNGNVIATCTLTVERTSESTQTTTITRLDNGASLITVSLDVLNISIKLELDKNTLNIVEVEPTIEPKPEPTTGSAPEIIASDDYDNYQQWTQITAVDIFTPRLGNQGVKTIDGATVISPGATGSYTFKIKNSEASSVKYNLNFVETDQNDPNLPLQYRLKTGSDYIGGADWKDASDLSVISALIPAGKTTYYTLEWKWVTTSDSIDTASGLQSGNPVYVLNIMINAQYE